MTNPPRLITAPWEPQFRLALGVTGHRVTHAVFSANRARVAEVLNHIFELCDNAASDIKPKGATRLHCTDQLVAELALARGYELVCPLPFGRRLNKAINALPVDAEDARSMLAGGDAVDQATQERAESIRALSDRAQIFALAD
jgi:hypothetical protein